MLSTKNTLSLLCLALSVKPISGYDIFKQISAAWSHQQVYRELKKLRSRGLVTYVSQTNDGKPDSKIYTITSEGHRQVEVLLTKLRKEISIGRNTPRHLLAALIQLNKADMITFSEAKDFLAFWQNELVRFNANLQNELKRLRQANRLTNIERMIYMDKIAANQTLSNTIGYSLKYDLV